MSRNASVLKSAAASVEADGSVGGAISSLVDSVATGLGVDATEVSGFCEAGGVGCPEHDVAESINTMPTIGSSERFNLFPLGGE